MKISILLYIAVTASVLFLSCEKKTYCYACLTTTTMKASDSRDDAIAQESIDYCDISPSEKAAIERNSKKTSTVAAGEVVLTTTVATVCTRKSDQQLLIDN